jgi:hypothetical protein
MYSVKRNQLVDVSEIKINEEFITKFYQRKQE